MVEGAGNQINVNVHTGWKVRKDPDGGSFLSAEPQNLLRTLETFVVRAVVVTSKFDFAQNLQRNSK